MWSGEGWTSKYPEQAAHASRPSSSSRCTCNRNNPQVEMLSISVRYPDPQGSVSFWKEPDPHQSQNLGAGGLTQEAWPQIYITFDEEQDPDLAYQTK